MKLSVVMAVFNEAETLEEAVRQVREASHVCPVELVVVDDGSTDATARILDALRPADDLVVVHHPRNRGKGASIRTGLRFATGDYALIFDGDLEYDAEDIPRMVEPVLSGRAECVFGVRHLDGETGTSFRYVVGNRLMTLAANALFDCWINDLHTCLKLLPVEVMRELAGSEKGFGIDTEVTARALRLGIRPYEVAVHYRPRTREEGKKIGWRDGMSCLGILVRERLRRVPDGVVVEQRSPRRVALEMAESRSGRIVLDLRLPDDHPVGVEANTLAKS